MFKTFIFGILLGIAATAGLLYFVPVVDQHRELSLISVEPNGGNSESFHINLPDDRIMVGTAGPDATIPSSLEWPGNEVLANAKTELFKVRDDNDVVVGVASRISGGGESTGSVIEWTLHLPARGTIYATMQPMAVADGERSGLMRAGTHEFANLHGSVRERLIGADAGDAAGSDVGGRIELTTALVGTAGEDE